MERLSCAVCGNKEPGSLKYFYGEGEEAYRIDLGDKCHHYIKTIDDRNLEASDPSLEDLATLHLDVVAVQKGYKRAVPNPWSTWKMKNGNEDATLEILSGGSVGDCLAALQGRLI